MSLNDEIAVIGDEETLSFRQLCVLIDQLSIELRSQGIAAGVTVGTRFRNPVKHLVTSLALLKEGITQVSIPPRESAVAQKQIADITTASVIASDTLEPLIQGRRHLIVTSDWSLNTAQPIQVVSVEQKSGPALLVIGSGTTGRPKLMAVDFPLLAHLIQRDQTIRNRKPGERHFSESSFDYFTSKRRSIGCLAEGVTVMLPHTPPRRLVSYCQEHNIHHLSLTTSQATAMLEREKTLLTPDFPRLPTVRSIFVSSSPVSENLRLRLRREISSQLFVGYGSNEFGEATVTTPSDLDTHSETVGKACPGVTVTIIDNSGNPCPPGVKGHIRLNSNPMMQGYHSDSLDSGQHFRKDGFYPGDVGSLTEDGNLIFAGRSDDMMIYRGVNIYPREIEAVLESHPAVSDAAAFPLLSLSHENIPFAVVCASNISENLLLQYCQERLGWRRPARIFFAKSLPRNAGGKILKRALADKVVNLLKAERPSSYGPDY